MDTDIKYAFLAGALEGMMKSLSYTLVREGLVDGKDILKLSDFIDAAILRAKQLERERDKF
jgi:hypothetical protein